GSTGPLLAGDLVEMAGGAGLLEWRHGHEPLVLAAAVAGRAGLGNALRRILLRHFRVVLAEMAGMIVDEARAPLERIALEIRVMTIESIEFHNVTGVALLIREFRQIEAGTLVLLVTCGAVEIALGHTTGRKGGILRAGR